MPQQLIEIFPKEKKHWLLLIVCLAFTTLLVYRIFLGQPLSNTKFLLTLAVIVIVIILKNFGSKRTASLTLSPAYLEFHYDKGRISLPWTDVHAVGAYSFASKNMVGIRLKCYNRYLEAMSPSLMKFLVYDWSYGGGLFFPWLLGRLKVMPPSQRLFSRNPALLIDQTPPTLWSGFRGLDIPASLDEMGTLGLMVQTLLFSRLSTGFDLTLPQTKIDRPVKEFVALLEGYLTSSGAQETR